MAEGEVPPVALAEQPQSNKRLWKFGAWITAAWLGAFALYIVTCWAAFVKMQPNEFGDFLAGVFAPLAFLWLVLGFFQQGEELQNSAAALWLQGRELQNSVAQQRELVSVTREQLQFESEMLQEQRKEIARNSQPVLELVSGMRQSLGAGRGLYEMVIVNHGKPCTKVAATFEYGDKKRGANFDALLMGSRGECRLELPDAGEVAIDAQVTYLDDRLLPGKAAWRITRKNGGLVIERVGLDGATTT